jgi:hypothetical protein
MGTSTFACLVRLLSAHLVLFSALPFTSDSSLRCVFDFPHIGFAPSEGACAHSLFSLTAAHAPMV